MTAIDHVLRVSNERMKHFYPDVCIVIVLNRCILCGSLHMDRVLAYWKSTFSVSIVFWFYTC